MLQMVKLLFTVYNEQTVKLKLNYSSYYTVFKLAQLVNFMLALI